MDKPTEAMLADGWITHDGGPCPVPLDSRPLVMFRDGFGVDDYPDAPTAGEWLFANHKQNLWTWSRLGPADIIAYKQEQPQ